MYYYGFFSINSAKLKYVQEVPLKMLLAAESCLLTGTCLIVRKLNSISKELNEKVN